MKNSDKTIYKKNRKNITDTVFNIYFRHNNVCLDFPENIFG